MLFSLFFCFTFCIESSVLEEIVESNGERVLQVTMMSQGDKNYNFSEYDLLKLQFQDTDGVVVLFNRIGYEYTFHFGENNSEIISREKIYYLSDSTDFILIRKTSSEEYENIEIEDLQISFKPDFKQDSKYGFVTTDPIPAFYMVSHSRGESINHTIFEGESISYFNASPYLRKSYIEYYFTGSDSVSLDIGDGNGEVSGEETNTILTDWHYSFFFHVSGSNESECPMLIYMILSMPTVNNQYTQNSANISSFTSGPYPMQRICTIFKTKRAYVCLGQETCHNCPLGYELIRTNELNMALSFYVEESGDRQVSVVYDGYGVGYFNSLYLRNCDVTITSYNPEIIIDFDFVDTHLSSLKAINSTLRRITSKGTEYEIIEIDHLILINSLLTSVEVPISIVTQSTLTDFNAIQNIASLSIYNLLEFTGYLPYIEEGISCKLSISRDATLILPESIKYLNILDDYFVKLHNETTELLLYAKNVQIKGSDELTLEGSMIEKSNPMTITVFNAFTTVKGQFSQDSYFSFNNVDKLNLLTPINFTIKENAEIEVSTEVLLSSLFKTTKSTVITKTNELISRISLTRYGFYIYQKQREKNYVYLDSSVTIILYHNSVNTVLSFLPEQNPTEIPQLTVYALNNSKILFEKGWADYHGTNSINVIVDPKSNYAFTSYDMKAPPCIDIKNSNGEEYDVTAYVSTIPTPSPTPPVENKTEQIIMIVCIVLSIVIVLTFIIILLATPLGSVCGINTYKYCCFKPKPPLRKDIPEAIDPIIPNNDVL